MQVRSRISDDSVSKATGKRWSEWFSILDKAGAKKMVHLDVVRLIQKKHLGRAKAGINVATRSGWWAQMVTVEYERERGLRSVNQNATGFLVAVHKTASCSVVELQKKWNAILKTPAVKKKNLVRIPSKTKRAMLRYSSAVGGVVVMFDARGSGKSRIMVEAIKLPNKAAVESARAFWKKVLHTLEV